MVSFDAPAEIEHCCRVSQMVLKIFTMSRLTKLIARFLLAKLKSKPHTLSSRLSLKSTKIRIQQLSILLLAKSTP